MLLSAFNSASMISSEYTWSRALGYWFDNNSDISTIYSDKPINFNLNVGVRFNVGK